MADYINNRFRKASRPAPYDELANMVADDASAVMALLAQCPKYEKTPLSNDEGLARSLGFRAIYIKEERARMGLGSFKALGAAFVIAQDADRAGGDIKTALQGKTYVTASAGNHGLSVAAGARLFGAKAVIFLSETVPASFAARLREKGAEVKIAGDTYEASMAAAAKYAADEDAILLSDSTWQGYTTGARVMEGYLALADEIVEDLDDAPSHVFLQAGVGGLAGAMAARFRRAWGDAPKIIVVEPSRAAALYDAIVAGHVVTSAGDVSAMGRLDCKEASEIALAGLMRDADVFMLIDENDAEAAIEQLQTAGYPTSPSGAAGFAGLVCAAQDNSLALGKDSRVLVILSEGAVDD